MFELSPGQMSALVCHEHKTRYAMDCVRVREDGTTESTDGKMWLRVSPKERSAGAEECLIDGKALAKACRERRKDKRRKPGSTVCVDMKAKALKYEAGEQRVSLVGAVHRNNDDVGAWPPIEATEEKYKAKKPKATVTLHVGNFMMLLGTLKKAGAITVRVDILDERSGDGMRIKCDTQTDTIVGLLMPCQT